MKQKYYVTIFYNLQAKKCQSLTYPNMKVKDMVGENRRISYTEEFIVIFEWQEACTHQNPYKRSTESCHFHR